jgi:hypothetical protein
VTVGSEGAIILWKIPDEMNAKDTNEGLRIGDSQMVKTSERGRASGPKN